MDPIRQWINEQLAREAAAREAACEAALQTGVCGVRETRSPGEVTFEVTLQVPFGHIFVDDGVKHWTVGE